MRTRQLDPKSQAHSVLRVTPLLSARLTRLAGEAEDALLRLHRAASPVAPTDPRIVTPGEVTQPYKPAPIANPF